MVTQHVRMALCVATAVIIPLVRPRRVAMVTVSMTHAHTGDHCEYCALGYTGNPINGEMCEGECVCVWLLVCVRVLLMCVFTCVECECNGFGTACHNQTGVCYCDDYGVAGDHCTKFVLCIYVHARTHAHRDKFNIIVIHTVYLYVYI